MTIHDVNLQQQHAELFFELLFHQLAAKERVEVRHKLPGEGQPMRRAFYADPKVAARNAILLGRREEVYVGAAPRRGEEGTKAGVSRLLAIWADLDAKGSHTREPHRAAYKAPSSTVDRGVDRRWLACVLPVREAC